MNKRELDRMLELVDDKYIEEAEPKKKRKSIWKVALLPVAAIIGVSVILISGIIKNREAYHNEQSDDNGIIESNNVENSVEDTTEQGQDVAEIDYKPYFQAQVAEVAIDYTLEAGGASYTFESGSEIYTELGIAKLPFGCEDYNVSAMAFCDNEGDVENAVFTLDNRSGNKNIMITASASGNLHSYSCFTLNDYEGMDRNGVAVYGYETLVDGSQLGLNLYFVSDGVGYSICATYLQYNEVGLIMDAIIEHGIPIDTFDLSLGVKHTHTREELTLEQAAKLDTFTRLIPSINIVADMELEKDKCYYYVDYEDDKPICEGLDILYYNNDNDYITLYLVTDGTPYKEMKNVLTVEAVTQESVAEHKYPSDISGNNWYSFIIESDGIYISVTANCTEQELWVLLGNIGLQE